MASVYTVRVDRPGCDYCGEPAFYEASDPKKHGQWGAFCEKDFNDNGMKLGWGKGQRILLNREIRSGGLMPEETERFIRESLRDKLETNLSDAFSFMELKDPPDDPHESVRRVQEYFTSLFYSWVADEPTEEMTPERKEAIKQEFSLDW